MYALNYKNKIKEELEKTIFKNVDWQPLPLSNEKYEEYIKKRLYWALEKSDYFQEYALTSSDCFGYWQFRGHDRALEEWDVYAGGESFPVYNIYETVLLLENENTILFVHQVN